MTAAGRSTLKNRVFQMAMACLVMLAGAATSPAAFAENGGVHHGLMCQGIGLAQSVSGVWNSSAATRYVFCPTVRDEVYSTHGLNRALVYYRLQAGTSISCSFYSLNSLGQSVAAASRTGSGVSGTLIFPALSGASAGNYMVYCSLPPGGIITSYRIDEWS